jgi:alpha-tubulin suppressor-like RCC1 family protein
MMCWGNNTYGQLGDGTLTQRSTPVAVLGATGVDRIAAGASHTCLRWLDGRVACFGRADLGQTGTGATENTSRITVPVVGL